ncbi:hypothetical protein D3C78_1311250 [compost metagenome]
MYFIGDDLSQSRVGNIVIEGVPAVHCARLNLQRHLGRQLEPVAGNHYALGVIAQVDHAVLPSAVEIVVDDVGALGVVHLHFAPRRRRGTVVPEQVTHDQA